MKNWILTLTYLATGSLFANTTGFVEYDLPACALEWPVIHQDEATESTLIGSITENGTEFFGAVYNAQEAPLPDCNELQTDLQIPFPDQKVKVTPLETESNSVLFEWSVSDETNEVVHGWGRLFSSDKGIVSLSYTTGQIEEVAKAREVWLPILKKAKIQSEKEEKEIEMKEEIEKI